MELPALPRRGAFHFGEHLSKFPRREREKEIIHMKKIMLLLLVTMLVGCSIGSQSELSRNQAKWEAAGITNYRYSLYIGCFCVFRDRMPVTVEVKDGKMASMSYQDGTPLSDEDRQIDFFQKFSTIDGIFIDLKSGQAAKADEVKVSYDPTYGFPSQVEVDQIKNAMDDEFSVRVSDFEILQ
jgi:hypothetical protein